MTCKVGNVEITWLPEEYSKSHPDNRQRILTRRYYFTFQYHGKPVRAYIRKNFVWDGASIPRAFWTSVGSPFCGKHRLGAIPHDGFYEGVVYNAETNERIALTRSEADDLLLSCCIFKKQNWLTRNKIWVGVRGWGWTYKYGKGE